MLKWRLSMGAEGEAASLGLGLCRDWSWTRWFLWIPSNLGCSGILWFLSELLTQPGYKGTTQKRGADIDLIPEDTTHSWHWPCAPASLHPREGAQHKSWCCCSCLTGLSRKPRNEDFPFGHNHFMPLMSCPSAICCSLHSQPDKLKSRLLSRAPKLRKSSSYSV